MHAIPTRKAFSLIYQETQRCRPKRARTRRPPHAKRPADESAGRVCPMAEMRANRTHPRRSARLTTALKAAGSTRSPSISVRHHTIVRTETRQGNRAYSRVVQRGAVADGGSGMQRQAAQPTGGAARCSNRRRSRRTGQRDAAARGAATGGAATGGAVRRLTARRSHARRCSRPAWDRARPRCRRTPSARRGGSSRERLQASARRRR